MALGSLMFVPVSRARVIWSTRSSTHDSNIVAPEFCGVSSLADLIASRQRMTSMAGTGTVLRTLTLVVAVNAAR